MKTALKTLLIGLAIGVIAIATQAQEDSDVEGGILGTGIVGTITALGSIIVNEQHIDFAPDLEVSDGIGAQLAATLRPGQTVAVIAEQDGRGWKARHIRMVYPVVGPATVDSNGQVAVMGTKVITDAKVQDGDWVAVSGLWQESHVVASDIEILSDYDGPARITGTYLQSNAGHEFEIGGTTLSDLPLQHAVSGDALRIYGTPVANGLRATRVEKGLFHAQVGVVQVQGYYSAPQPDGLYTVLGSGLLAYTDQPGMISTLSPVIRCGRSGVLGGESEQNSTLCQQD